MSESKKNLPIQWFIITCSNGNEDTVIKNLKAKVQAMHLDEYIVDAKVIKKREIIEDFFDDKNPQKLPPKSMRNSTNIKWKTLGNGKYQKVKIIDRNKFPGYIYVKMVMNDDTWYAVRNAQNVSGLVGSSGKGTKPFPITIEEELLLSGECEDPNTRIVITPNAIIEMDRKKFDENGNLIGFEDSINNLKNDIKTEKMFSDEIQKIMYVNHQDKIEDGNLSNLPNNEDIVSSSNDFIKKNIDIKSEEKHINTSNTNEIQNELKEPNNVIEKFDVVEKKINLNDKSKLFSEVNFSEQNNNFYTDKSKSEFKVGHTVEIILGEYIGLNGVIIGLNDEIQKANVEIEIMGKNTNIYLPYTDIKLKK